MANSQDLKNRAAQRKTQYGRKILGSFKDGTILHNDADHPDHSKFSMSHHMRAATIHADMAKRNEASGQHIEAAHHREQAAKHNKKWKAERDARSPKTFTKSEFREGTQRKGSNPLNETLNTGEDLQKRSKNVREQTRNLTPAQRKSRFFNYMKRLGFSAREGRQDRFGVGPNQREITYTNMAGSPEHEMGHVLETPVGTTLREHQKALGQVTSQVGMPQDERIEREGVAFKLQPKIERRAGVAPSSGSAHKYWATRKKFHGSGRADKEMAAFDEGRKVIGPKGEVQEGQGIHARINRRALQKDDKPKIEIVPHPEEVIDVNPEVLIQMERKLATANTKKLLAAVKLATQGGGQYDPSQLSDDFKNELDRIIQKPLKKAQYAKTEPPEERAKTEKIKRKQAEKKKEIAKDLKADTIRFLQEQKAGAGSKAFPAKPKKTLRGVKKLEGGDIINKPEKPKSE